MIMHPNTAGVTKGLPTQHRADISIDTGVSYNSVLDTPLESEFQQYHV